MVDLTLLRADDVAERLARSRSQLFLDTKRGVMPPPVKRGKWIAWPEYEVDEVAKAIVAGSSDDELRALTRALIERRAAGRPGIGAA